MTARRRRIGSESDQQPLILAEKTPSFSSQSFRENGFSSSSSSLIKDPPKMSRDRTSEFANAIRSLQGRTVIRAVSAQDPARAQNIQNYGEFMMLARSIGRNISSTYDKLEKLTLLAKRKPLFNDRPTEIQELTYIIKEDLNSLNSQIAKLQEVIRSQNEKRNRSKTQHLFSHSSSVVLTLQSKLASMSSQFKHVLEVRTENLKEAKRRQDQFSQAPLGPAHPPPGESSYLLGREVAIDMQGTSRGRQQQSQLLMSYDETDQYLTTRAETMQNIESTIVELGGIFQQLAHMVKEQEEMVDRIDANVHDTELNVEAAHSEILKYFQSISSNRWLMIKIFGVLIFFFMFFLIFMA
ncbi:unnamed protein product [Nezara viridula]|uniref:t-SNARE coiled-coil homology domain-containing protein n=1 Tax=Nezara viridula TaxID=85310 RepID=A0A9P0MWI8_NEZVI|nr:unnamed protein product [Nezara viridula]